MRSVCPHCEKPISPNAMLCPHCQSLLVQFEEQAKWPIYLGFGFLFVLVLAPEFYRPLRILGSAFHAGLPGAEAAKRIFSILATISPSSIS